jgi:hypothetical protein
MKLTLIVMGLLFSLHGFAASFDGIYERPDGERLFLKSSGSLPSDLVAVDIVPKGKAEDWPEGDHFNVTFNGNISSEDTIRANQCDVTLTLLKGAVAVNDKCGGDSSGMYRKLTSATDDSPWNDPSCNFKKVSIMGSPERIVKQFVDKDSRGEFIGANPTGLDLALCPGGLRAPDVASIKVISGYKIENYQVKTDTAEVNVRYDVLGTLSVGGPNHDMNTFDSDAKEESVKFELAKTPYGWRFKTFRWQAVRASALAAHPPHKVWADGDYQKFLKATGLPATPSK